MKPKHFAIIGGGFAGITLASRLERLLPPAWELTLLSRENHITYSPLLAEVVGASILPGHVVAPTRQMLRRTLLAHLHFVRSTRNKRPRRGERAA